MTYLISIEVCLMVMEIKNLHTEGSKVTTVPGISWYVPVRGDFRLFAHTNWLVHWYWYATASTVPY